MAADDRETTVTGLLSQGGWKGDLSLTGQERRRLLHSRARICEIAGQQPVYGISRGYGPLADHAADDDPVAQGTGLINHLTVGQGAPLPPTETRLMVWLRLRGMTLGHSGVEPRIWEQLSAQWNAGFTPVVPRDGSLSASGDLVPLAHAAQAAAGNGEAWVRTGSRWRRESAATALRSLELSPVRWEARSALAFVNGTSASLARVLVNHVRLEALALATAAATGRLAALLGSSGEPFSAELGAVRGHPGHLTAAELIRREVVSARSAGGTVSLAARPFQESYSLRCAPQVIGAVLDQLRLQEAVLVTEATGCSDNPVLIEDRIYHGGNFHAAPVALVSEQYAVCVHQLGYLLERQLALALDPRRNGGLPPLLAHQPGRTSGLAGVQIAASSHLAAIRQGAYPASCTPVPSNLDNQDHVPMALNSANAVSDMLDRAWWIGASVFIALSTMHQIQRRPAEKDLWGQLAGRTAGQTTDRPLTTDIAELAAWLENHFSPAEFEPGLAPPSTTTGGPDG